MSGLALVGWLLAGALAVLAGALGFVIVSDPVDAGRLHRFPQGDSVQGSGDLRVVCKAYTNRPTQDLGATHPGDWYGFRLVSDCRTVGT